MRRIAEPIRELRPLLFGKRRTLLFHHTGGECVADSRRRHLLKRAFGRGSAQARSIVTSSAMRLVKVRGRGISSRLIRRSERSPKNKKRQRQLAEDSRCRPQIQDLAQSMMFSATRRYIAKELLHPTRHRGRGHRERKESRPSRRFAVC